MRMLFPLAAIALLLTTPAFASEPATKSQSRLTSSESFIPLPPLVSATTSRAGIGGMLSVELGLDVPDPKLRTRVGSLRPRIQDALRSALAQYTSSYLQVGRAPDPMRISAMTQAALDRTLGQPGARVLLSNVMVTDRR